MDQSSTDPLFELRLDHEAGHHFKESSRWAKFLSIIYFVVIGVFLLALAFGANAIITTFGQYAGGFEGAAGLGQKPGYRAPRKALNEGVALSDALEGVRNLKTCGGPPCLRRALLPSTYM